MNEQEMMEKVIKGLECCAFGCCLGCPYLDIVDDCEGVLCADVLALLKAQEPRVLTLEEARALEQDTVVWYEHTGVHPPRPRIVHYADNEGIVFTDGGVWLFTKDDYGKTWRCWTSRPTDEQREAVKWE